MKIATCFYKNTSETGFPKLNQRRIALFAFFILLQLPASGCEFSSQNPTKDLPPTERIDLNHGTREELLRIPGLTPSWADRIIRFRPYATRRQLLEKGILPGQLYLRIRFFTIVHQKPRQ